MYKKKKYIITQIIKILKHNTMTGSKYKLTILKYNIQIIRRGDLKSTVTSLAKFQLLEARLMCNRFLSGRVL